MQCPGYTFLDFVPSQPLAPETYSGAAVFYHREGHHRNAIWTLRPRIFQLLRNFYSSVALTSDPKEWVCI